MRILWITNIVFPEANQLLKGEKTNLKISGGWLLGAADALVSHNDIKLAVATPCFDVTELKHLQGERIDYYLLPYGKGNIKYNADYEGYWKEIRDDFLPDIIHIHGTEYSHGLAYVRACGADHVVVSIQGVMGEISRYYLGGLTKKEIVRNYTFRDLMRKSLFSQQREANIRGRHETELLQAVSSVVGRTSFDYAHCKHINPNLDYYSCNETLRAEFYEGEWSYNVCTPNTIFLSQSTYPLKALHKVLEAIPAVARMYPDVQIRVAGNDITYAAGGMKACFRRSGYGNLLHRMIKKYHLENQITFVGQLDAAGMKKEFLNANLFICPSSMENSSNSLGEAQLLGVPVLASYVGGLPDMMRGDEAHLYRYEDTVVLAQKIMEFFGLKDRVDTSSMRTIAHHRHDAQQNNEKLLEIYRQIVQ